MPNSGTVFPQTETVCLSKAAAICIKPVSFESTRFDNSISLADSNNENLTHQLKTIVPTSFAINSPFKASSGPPNKTTASFNPLITLIAV